MIDEANEILRGKGYSAAHLHAIESPLPGKVLLKGTKILSPFSDTAEVVLRVARDFVPSCRRARAPPAHAARDARLAGRVVIVETSLLRQQAWLNGEWVDADSGETFAVTNPATGEELARVPRMGAAETRRGLEAAEAALPGWRARTAADRARILRRWADLMLEHLDDLALLLTLEQGKPLAESEAEIRYAASFLEWFGEEGKRVYGDTIPSPLPDRRILVLKQPVGVTRRDHAVELPVGDADPQGGARARRRLHDGAEARRADAALRARRRGARRGGRACRPVSSPSSPATRRTRRRSAAR